MRLESRLGKRADEDQRAASVASLLITTEAMVADRPKDLAGGSALPGVAQAAIGPSLNYRPYRSHGMGAGSATITEGDPLPGDPLVDIEQASPLALSGDVSMPGRPDVRAPKRPRIRKGG